MPLLVQICIVAVTIALVAVAVVLVRAIAQLERTMAGLEKSIPEIERTLVEARDVLDSLGQVIDRVDTVTQEFASTGSRLARASSMVVEEVIEPAAKIAALVKGVRAGATTLVGSLLKRGVAAASPNPGGNHHE